MKVSRIFQVILTVLVVAGLSVGSYLTRATWLPLLFPAKPAATTPEAEAGGPTEKVLVTDQAQKNLGLIDARQQSTARSGRSGETENPPHRVGTVSG